MSQTPSRPDPASPPGLPRWVKIMIIVFVLLVLTVITLHLTGLDFGHHMQYMP